MSNAAKILWENILRRSGATLTASTSAAGFPASNMLNPATFERWIATANSATLTLATPVAFGHIGIAAHNLAGATLTVTSVISGVTTTLFTGVLTSRTQLIVLSTSVTSASIAITHNTPPTIGVLFAGNPLVMEQNIYGGHTPISLARRSTVRPSISETGQWLGATVRRGGYASSFAWQNLAAAWYRANFDPFVKNNPRANPFFIAWRPAAFPAEVAYCWATDDIAPSNMGKRDLMSVSMNVAGFDDGN